MLEDKSSVYQIKPPPRKWIGGDIVLRKFDPGDVAVKPPVLQVGGQDMPSCPKRSASHRAVEPRPAPTSQQRQPVPTPTSRSAAWL